MTAPEPESVDTTGGFYEEYPRWVIGWFLFGPLVLAGYTTTAPVIVTTMGAMTATWLVWTIFGPWLAARLGTPRERERWRKRNG